jgi:uncharacterized protein (TIGR03437 family)
VGTVSQISASSGAFQSKICNDCAPGLAFVDGFATLIDFGQDPQFTLTGIGNAASYQTEAVAPGEIVVLFGERLGPDVLAGLRLTPAGLVDSSIGNVQVFFDGTAAPLIYVSKTQISAIVPYGTAGKSLTRIQVKVGDRYSDVIAVPVRAAVPGLFTANSSGKGPGAFFNEDGTLNSAGNPTAAGKIVSMYGTGEGQTNPAGVDGQPALTVYPKPLLPVSVTVGGSTAEILYAGAAPTAVAGLLQLNIRVPVGLSPGPADVVLKIGSHESVSGVTLALK